MITSIEITNYRSIKKARLDFAKGKYQYLPQYVLNDSVANPIAIYGHNGSGKSSFFQAIMDMVALLINDKDKLNPFIFNFVEDGNEKEKSGISVSFVLGEDKYCYSVYTAIEGINSEKLEVNDKSVFSRSLEEIKYEKNNTISISLFPALRYLFSNNSFENKYINNAYSYLSNLVCISGCSQRYLSKSLDNQLILDVLEEKSTQVKDILKTYNSFPLYNVTSVTRDGQKRYYLSVDIDNNKTMTIPYVFASMGMKSQSALLTLLLKMPSGGALFVDELEVALHPATIMNFINLVVEKNIQLIFTSHNTFILSKLRPDNVVFAHWKKGYSTYSRLSDIYPNIREINNIEKMYLSNTFDEEIENAK